jgi:hypothetical protein
MSTLAEIEAAAKALPTPEKVELVRSLNRQLERELAVRPEVDIAKFAGTISLAQDPLEWQRAVRDEWQ